MGATVYSCHRTLGTEKQRVNVIIENSEDHAPNILRSIYVNCVNDLKNVVGVSSTENFVRDSATIGDLTGVNKHVNERCNILATFKTPPNWEKYITLPIFGINPVLGQDAYAGIHTAINNAVADVTATATGTTDNWVLVSCNITFYRESYVEGE